MNSTTVGRINFLAASIYCTFGTIGLVVNILVFIALPRCDRLKPATMTLMRAQCFANTLGLMVMGIFNTFAAATGMDISPYDFGIPGGLLVWVAYTQFALQVAMAFNRYYAFRDFTQSTSRVFDKAHTRFYLALCALYGLTHGALCFTPFCRLNIDPTLHKWVYVGRLARWRQKATILNDLVVYPTMLACYICTVRLMRGFKSSLQKNQKSQMRREQRFLFQFALIASIWFAYSLFFRAMYFLPMTYFAAFVSEFLRFLMFSIDPLVYLYFVKQLVPSLVQVAFCSTAVHPISTATTNRRSTAR